jgi:hypothetical protein
MLSPLYAGSSLLDEENNVRERVRNRTISITIKPPRGRRSSPEQKDQPLALPSILKPAQPLGLASDFTKLFRSTGITQEAWRAAVYLDQTLSGIDDFSSAENAAQPVTNLSPLLVDCWRDDVISGYTGSLNDWAAINV